MNSATGSSSARNGKATTIKTKFSRETSVQIDIKADQSIIWALLTNLADYTRWNTTILSIVGSIEEGEKIILRSVLAPKRTFKLKVKEVQPGKKMVWGDSTGERTYTLTPIDSNTCSFTMTEKIGGLFFPLYAKYIPSFDQTFEQFAADLKKEAELIEAKNK